MSNPPTNVHTSFVCAQRIETGTIARLRSYPVMGVVPDEATIWEAALATSAATSFFKPVKIGDCKYGDGGLGANNPARQVESEATRIWCETDGMIQPQVKCFLSIGTGNGGINPTSDKAWTFITKSLTRLATDTTATAQDVAARWENVPGKPYFRFNVETGLSDVGLAECEKAGLLRSATLDYLDEVDTKPRVNSCVEILRTKECW